MALYNCAGGNGGGGGGTSDYAQLSNLPQINNTTLLGNKSAADLGLVGAETGKGLSSNDYTNTDKAIVDGVTSALAGKVDKVTGKGLSSNDYTNADKGIVDGVTSALAGKVDTSLVGSANGIAELDANGRVPSSQLPSYVDDVLEYADLAHFPATGETGKIYIAEDTNKTYRWSGSDYAEISESLALGETSSTAYAGNKGKANADAIEGIKNGTSINSFSAVETALQSYATKAYVNGFFANLGSFTVNDLNTFFKSSVIAFHQLNPIAQRGYSVVTDWAYNGRFTGFFTDYTDSVDFVIAGGDNKRIFCGRYLIQADVLEVRTYMNSDKEQTVVSLDSTYDAGTDWNIVKQGNICVMNMRTLKDIPVGNTVIGNIPVGFRPESNFSEFVYSQNKNINIGVNIYDSGDVQILNPTGAVISDTVHFNRNVTYFTA